MLTEGPASKLLAELRRVEAGFSAGDLQTLRDLAEATVAYEGNDDALSALADETGASSAWVRAALLEAGGQTADALSAYETMPELAWGDLRAQRWLAVARLRAKLGKADAATALRDAIRTAASYRTLRQADAMLRTLRKKKLPLGGLRPCRIAVLSSFTADFLPEVLRPLLFAAGIDAAFWNAPFGQVQQTLLAGSPAIDEFRPNAVMLAMDWRTVDQTATPEAHVAQLKQLWQAAHARFGATAIQFNYEIPSVDPMGRLSRLLPGGRRRHLEAVNAALWEAEVQKSGAVILDVEKLAGEFGKDRWNDTAAWEISRQYPSSAALPALGRGVTSLIRALLGMTSKCLALDLDGVMWGGVIGEDGLNGIRIGGTGSGAAHAAFQTYCKGLKSRGVLLAVCSKNNPEDAIAPFRGHPEMVLREEDIAVFAANWQPKEENLRRIAEQINIGLDAIVFADDNPAERERIRQHLPMVEVPEMPVDPSGYAAALNATGLFESLGYTDEDALRTESIRANSDREALAASAGDPVAFLRGLEMKLQAQAFDEANLPRIVQLFNKTNQFNMTTRRVTEMEVRDWMNRPDAFTLSVRLLDRFGDFGLTGMLVAFERQDCLQIDSWLMSCRILGRGVEQAMLALALGEAARRGCRVLAGEWIPTAKNKPAAGVYSQFGFADAGGGIFRLPLAEAQISMPDYLQLQ